jgi:hypothetical protein
MLRLLLDGADVAEVACRTGMTQLIGGDELHGLRSPRW